jgi:hypothetical protein
MSIIIIFLSSVDSVLLIRILEVVMSAVDVATSLVQSSMSPSTVNMTHSFSALLGLWSQTSFPYVIFRSFGILDSSTKKHVVVTWMSLVP